MLVFIRLRHVYMLALALYTFVNVLLMEALPYYGLPVEQSYMLVLIVVSVVLIWEGNRLIQQGLVEISRVVGSCVHPLPRPAPRSSSAASAWPSSKPGSTIKETAWPARQNTVGDVSFGAFLTPA